MSSISQGVQVVSGSCKRPGNYSPFEPPKEPVELPYTLVKPSEAMRSVSDGWPAILKQN